MQLRFSYLHNKNTLERAINHRYPLEIPSIIEFSITNDEPSDKGIPKKPNCIRMAAVETRQRITEQLQTEAFNITFFFPRDCHNDM